MKICLWRFDSDWGKFPVNSANLSHKPTEPMFQCVILMDVFVCIQIGGNEIWCQAGTKDCFYFSDPEISGE